MTGSAWQIRFLWNDYPWLAAAAAQGGSLVENGSVAGSPVQVHRDPANGSGNKPLQLTGRYIEQDSSFPFQTLSLGIQQVFINDTACAEVAAAPDADSQTAAEAVLAVLGADTCYLPIIESRVLALNASSIEEAQEILSPLCSQQFCCSPVRGPAPQPGSQPRPGFSFLPGPAHPPHTSNTAAEDVLPQVHSETRSACRKAAAPHIALPQTPLMTCLKTQVSTPMNSLQVVLRRALLLLLCHIL